MKSITSPITNVDAKMDISGCMETVSKEQNVQPIKIMMKPTTNVFASPTSSESMEFVSPKTLNAVFTKWLKTTNVFVPMAISELALSVLLDVESMNSTSTMNASVRMDTPEPEEFVESVLMG